MEQTLQKLCAKLQATLSIMVMSEMENICEILMHTKIISKRLLSKDDTQERLLFCYKNVSSNANQKFLSAKNLLRILLIDLVY